MEKNVIYWAKNYYDKLKTFINTYNELKIITNKEITRKDLLKLCDLLGGHNLRDELFDLNYGTICATIYFVEGNKLIEPHLILGDMVEIWDDLNGKLLCDNYDMSVFQVFGK